jgi:hypothetical protein
MDKIINEYLIKKNEKPKINTIEKSKKKKGGTPFEPGVWGLHPHDKNEKPKIKYIK